MSPPAQFAFFVVPFAQSSAALNFNETPLMAEANAPDSELKYPPDFDPLEFEELLNSCFVKPPPTPPSIEDMFPEANWRLTRMYAEEEQDIQSNNPQMNAKSVQIPVRSTPDPPARSKCPISSSLYRWLTPAWVESCCRNGPGIRSLGHVTNYQIAVFRLPSSGSREPFCRPSPHFHLP